MTFKDAQSAILRELNRSRGPSDDEVVLLEEHTIEKDYGWIFFFNSKRFIETGDILYALAGNGPVAVEHASGRITFLGTARPVEEEIADFEHQNDLRG